MAIKLESIISAWKCFKLNDMQQELDLTASEITLKQDESDELLKKLVEHLKECKKNYPDSARQLSPLIKNFQKEVDHLSKRCKLTETAFLKCYQRILELSDPTPALEYCLGLEKKVFLQEELEVENKELKVSLTNLKSEIKEAKVIGKEAKDLRDRLEIFEEQSSAVLENKTKEVRDQLYAEFASKETFYSEKVNELELNFKKSEEKCSHMQSLLEQSNSELFEIKSKYDDIVDAKNREIEILVGDFERVNNRLLSSQKEIQQLHAKSEVDQPAHENTNLNAVSVENSYEAEISSKEKEISNLIVQIKVLESSFNDLKRTYCNDKLNFESQLRKSDNVIKDYETKLVQYKDYEELKKELHILKSVEFNMCESLKQSDETSKPLELLLLEKNKILQDENMSYRLKCDDFVKIMQLKETELSEIKSLSTNQENLISQLESDLLEFQTYTQSCNENSSQFELLSNAVESISHEENSVVAVDLRAKEQYIKDNAATDQLLSIVSSQRDRFKVRNEELEMEVSNKDGAITSLETRLESLRQDNLKLYEKIRFLQSFEGNRSSTTPAISSESKYLNQYEKNLDPFASFAQREKQNKYLSLSPVQKIMLSVCHSLVHSNTARSVIFIYALFLHCLIFIVLYKFAFNESVKSEYYSNCAEEFAEHMRSFHGHK